jgi:leucyl/phenylalanyl-tRNA--protein transferase
MLPVLLPRDAPPWFPSPRSADGDGLVAVGGDLSAERLLLAYDMGIFPWYDEGPPLWWSPDPRAVIEPDALHVPRRLDRTIRSGVFETTWDRAFEDVLRGCAQGREGGTWLIPEMIDAYIELHGLGHAHSVEVRRGGELVGGLYGVHRGGLFVAESMFHRVRDASKVALVVAVRSLARAGIELFDVQLPTPHLARFGTVALPRGLYLRRVRMLRGKTVPLAGLELV